MKDQYELRPINEFRNVRYRSEFDRQLIEKLSDPTRMGADWYLEMAPPYYPYDKVHSIFDGGKLESEFQTKYLTEAAQKPDIRKPYMWLDENWNPRPIIEDPAVLMVIEDLVRPLPDIANWIRQQPEGEENEGFALYLEKISQLLLAGEFDQAMIEFLTLDPKFNVRFLALPVEYRGDPMGDKAFPQGLLAYVDRDRTDEANRDLERYNRASQKLFGKKPFPAWIFAADTVIASGDLALSNSPKSGFHIPNDEKIASEAKHSAIYFHPNSIDQINADNLAPGLVEVAGVDSSTGDIIYTVTGHEFAHGFKGDQERERLGPMRTVVRESWAAVRGVVLTADMEEFTPERLASVVRGTLAYAISDCESQRSKLYLPYGYDQPSFKSLKATSGYTPGGFWLARQAALRGAMGKTMDFKEIDIDKIVEIAREQDGILTELAMKGDENSAFERLSREIEERPGFSTNNSVEKDFQAA